jgi:mannose/fructose-specific phosphotransferase system component IIA
MEGDRATCLGINLPLLIEAIAGRFKDLSVRKLEEAYHGGHHNSPNANLKRPSVDPIPTNV